MLKAVSHLIHSDITIYSQKDTRKYLTISDISAKHPPEQMPTLARVQ